ncbi:MAG: polysaccharide deacetylase family protein [Clostridiales bacterium]|nr:polysaccharide deacetylase family protein [Clostridiales bacterium]
MKKATIITFLCCLMGLFIFGITPAGKAVMAAAAKRDLPIYSVSKDYNVCSLSFDAAWGNEDTQTLIDILGKYHIKATFFVVGQWVDKYPESVKALSDAGHEVMNHSNTHPHMPQLSAAKMIDEIKQCDDKIEKVTGKRPFLFRPPYGDYDDKVVSTLRSQGHYTIQWDVDSLDWKELSAKEITDRVLKKVQPGSIILFHNAAKNTPAALPGIIEGLIQKGYKFAPISELIYRDNFTIDHTGKQIPNPKE